MSLLQSIFGGSADASDHAEKKKNAGLSALFDKKLPLKAPKGKQEIGISSQKKKRKQDDSSPDEDTRNNKKKRRDASCDDSSSSSSSNSEKDSAPENGTATTNRKKSPRTDPKEEETRTVFVGNLPLSTTRKSLAKLFHDCGKVQSTRFRSAAVTGVKLPAHRAGDQNMVRKVCTNTQQFDVEAKASLQGYVLFASMDSVEKALLLNNTPVPDDSAQATRSTRRIRVDTASPTTFDTNLSVFVGNLTYQAEEASLQDHFVQGCHFKVEDVQGVRIVRNPETFQCKGFGYVLFRDRNMVAVALQKMHESVYQKRPLRVTVCSKKGGNKHKNNKNRASGGNDNQQHQERSFEGRRATPVMEGAMKRVLKKQNKRVRGEKKKATTNKPGASSKANASTKNKPGVSKRMATEAKVDKRVKKLEKRMSKGMGKARGGK